jgi:hypothetical protein
MREKRPFAFVASFLFASPLAWLALVLVAALHGLYAWWFQPPAALHGAALLVDLATLAAGAALALRSASFRAYVNRAPLSERQRRLRAALPGCTTRFRDLALANLALIGSVGREFPDQRYDEELGTLSGTLARLAEANAELAHRARAYGSSAQKAQMERALEAQAASLSRMETSLRELAGNLALVEAQTDARDTSAEGLRDINESLEELLKEWSREKPASS